MLRVLVIDQERIYFEGQARRVIAPGERGVLEVWSLHRPMVSRLLPGSVIVDEQLFPIKRGVLKVALDEIIVIVEGPGHGP
ncbi:MAG: hypothetical protein HY597_03180 [Candidatus Omnitrophica bacterium]|nr:hypothetical protein [Candidatus Omnitrophota bacterium]